jgi:hypothetical protein
VPAHLCSATQKSHSEHAASESTTPPGEEGVRRGRQERLCKGGGGCGCIEGWNGTWLSSDAAGEGQSKQTSAQPRRLACTREEEQQLFVLLRRAAPQRQAALEGASVCISLTRSSVTCSGKRGSVALTPDFPSTNEDRQVTGSP